MFEELLNRGGLSIERLHALIQLGEEGSLIRAAKGDPGLQSRYSHQLKDLSEFFGVELTDRVGKTIRLTDAGERLVKLTREHFQSLTQFMHDAKGIVMRFRLGSADSLLQRLVVPAIANLARPGERLRFNLQDLRPEEIIGRLEDQRLEFGLLSGRIATSKLKTKVICDVRYIIVVPDRIAIKRGLLTLKQALLDCPHASISKSNPVRRAIESIAEELGGKYEPVLECASEAQCATAIRTGQFAAVLPLWAWDLRTEVEHTIYDEGLESLDQELVIAWHPRLIKTRGKPANDICNRVCDSLSELALETRKR